MRPLSRTAALAGNGCNGRQAAVTWVITVTLPTPMTSGAKSEGRFGKQDFVYLPEEDVYRCPPASA